MANRVLFETAAAACPSSLELPNLMADLAAYVYPDDMAVLLLVTSTAASAHRLSSWEFEHLILSVIGRT